MFKTIRGIGRAKCKYFSLIWDKLSRNAKLYEINLLPDQTTTLNESWLCFINSRENIRNADTNNFLIFISYSSFKVRFISQCNLHLKSRTRAVKFQKKNIGILEKAILLLLVSTYFFLSNKIQFEICLYLLFYEMNKHDAYFAIFSSLFFSQIDFHEWYGIDFFPRMSQHFKRFKTLLSMFFSYWNFRH